MCRASDYCCCSVHVDRAIPVIAIKSFILSIILSVLFIVQIVLFDKIDEPRHNPWYAAFRNLHRYFHYYWILSIQLLMAVILGVVSILLFIGNRIRNRAFYFPFLCVSVVELLVWLGTLALFILSAYKVADGGGIYVDDMYRDTCLIIMIVFIVLTSFFAALRAYLCIVVVYQAQDYLHRQEDSVQKISTVMLMPPRPTTPVYTLRPHFHSFFFMRISRTVIY